MGRPCALPGEVSAQRPAGVSGRIEVDAASLGETEQLAEVLGPLPETVPPLRVLCCASGGSNRGARGDHRVVPQVPTHRKPVGARWINAVPPTTDLAVPDLEALDTIRVIRERLDEHLERRSGRVVYHGTEWAGQLQVLNVDPDLGHWFATPPRALYPSVGRRGRGGAGLSPLTRIAQRLTESPRAGREFPCEAWVRGVQASGAGLRQTTACGSSWRQTTRSAMKIFVAPIARMRTGLPASSQVQ